MLLLTHLVLSSHMRLQWSYTKDLQISSYYIQLITQLEIFKTQEFSIRVQIYLFYSLFRVGSYI